VKQFAHFRHTEEGLVKTLVEGEGFTYSVAARDLLAPFVAVDMYRGWLDAGGSSVADMLDGNKEFKTGFKGAVLGLKGAALGLPSAVGIPSSTYRKRGGSDFSNTAEPTEGRP
jgi:hypothetical protein